MAKPKRVQIEVEIPDIIDAVIASLKEHETLVEVVRCGECVYWEQATANSGRCNRALEITAYATDYCSYGERRTDDE